VFPSLILKTFLIFLLTTNAHGMNAIVKKLGGTVFYSNKPLKINQKIAAGSLLEARGEKSFVHVKFDNGHQILLRDGQMKLEAQNVESKTTLVHLIRGIIHAFKDKKSSSELKVKTRHAAMGVRGTKFYVKETQQETYLCVCSGKVMIENSKGSMSVASSEDVHATANQTLVKKAASKDMIDMAWSGFKIMGLYDK
jgi:ferric-dicitrate binding protein FerR (iron transport regulator)